MIANQAKRKESSLRVFKVGIVGATPSALEALTRIFKVTRYRTRCYEAHAVASNAKNVDASIDFIILCTSNPHVLAYWDAKKPIGNALNRPLIRVCREAPAVEGASYTITVPVNPSRLLKQLDQYTIRELKFFPEFEIGNDSGRLCANTVAGLKLLKGQSRAENKRHGLQRALVVDDSLPVRRQIEIEFNLMDTEVDSVATAEDAIEASQLTSYDIIFLDVVMPGMDGYSACKKIKRSVLNKNTPVVMLTSRSSSFDKIKGTLAGCDSYLIKPINHNDFLSVVGKYFSEVKVVS